MSEQPLRNTRSDARRRAMGWPRRTRQIDGVVLAVAVRCDRRGAPIIPSPSVPDPRWPRAPDRRSWGGLPTGRWGRA
jgi:hypothetical protein